MRHKLQRIGPGHYRYKDKELILYTYLFTAEQIQHYLDNFVRSVDNGTWQ